MRSKTFQRILDEIEKKPWWYRIKLNLKVDCYAYLIIMFNKLKTIINKYL
jgi:hypothetical protein